MGKSYYFVAKIAFWKVGEFSSVKLEDPLLIGAGNHAGIRLGLRFVYLNRAIDIFRIQRNSMLNMLIDVKKPEADI